MSVRINSDQSVVRRINIFLSGLEVSGGLETQKKHKDLGLVLLTPQGTRKYSCQPAVIRLDKHEYLH